MNKSIFSFHKEYLALQKSLDSEEFFIALERAKNQIKTHKIIVYPSNFDLSLKYLERVIKTMLWAYGGYKFYLSGNLKLIDEIRKIYSENGERSFDYNFMQEVYAKPFEIVSASKENFPAELVNGFKIEVKTSGKRIGFDAGGSDRKVTAIDNNKVVYEKEIVWHPKLHSDIDYHISGIKDSIDTALKKLGGKVDSIGISTAGIVVDGEVRVASLFRKIPTDDYIKVKNIYKDLANVYNCSVKVANDGDVAALSGAINLCEGRVMGLALGTSLAGGYVDRDNAILGYLNELAFVPIYDTQQEPIDEWSNDKGVGVSYLSQDSVVRLSEEKNLPIDKILSPADKLKEAQKLVEKGNPDAIEIFTTIGEYLGNALMWYSLFYDIKTVRIMGRVVSGEGGRLILEKARKILDYEQSKIEIKLPDENERRLGQSYTAAML